jgi:hypothetical protein
MKNPRQKISNAKRHELLQVYLNLGQGPARELASEYGVAPDYGAKRANELGIQPVRKYRRGGKPSVSVDHNDPRWARALAIGVVVA